MSRCNRRLVLLTAIWLLSAAFGPRHWTGIFDATGRCSFSAPADWKIEEASAAGDSVASAPDGAAPAVLQWVHQSRTAFQMELRGRQAGAVIHESTPQRVWAEYSAGWPGRHHVAAIDAPDGACLLYVDVTARADHHVDDIVRAIVATLRAAGQ